MQKTQSIEIVKGDRVRIETTLKGFDFEGPAVIFIVTEEAAAGTTATMDYNPEKLKLQQFNQRTLNQDQNSGSI